MQWGQQKDKERNRGNICNNETFPKLMSDSKQQIQQAQRKLDKINAKTNKQTKNLHVGISCSN